MSNQRGVGEFVRVSMAALALTAGSLGGAAQAQTSAPSGAGSESASSDDDVVITAKATGVAAIAPTKGSLTETEPKAVITRQFIDESTPRVGDFTTIVSIAPSLAAVPQPNGPGLSDGAKITLRGFTDGNYNITYDGIAWGDTNGPSHHGTAFFPSAIIGGVVIDRGPGGATDLGQANFGGAINLYSLELDKDRSISEAATFGPWSTWQSNTTLQSGVLNTLHGAKFNADFNEYSSDGYLTNNFTHGNTQYIKGAVPLTDQITLTGLFTHTNDFYNKSDIGDASVAQLEQFGKNFSLGSNPALENYYGYNSVRKDTIFSYLKAAGDLGGGFGLDDTLYRYAYVNNTLSGQNNLANAAADFVTPTPGASYPAPGASYSAALHQFGIPGYVKLNKYDVEGDIFKLTKSFSFGKLTLGALGEQAHTQRYITDINLLTGLPDYREKAATGPGPSGVYVQNPLNIQYNEFSGWRQYQVFSQFEWKPIDALTITPGVKYLNFDLSIEAPEEKISVGNQPLYTDQDFTKTLPFLTANYRIANSWSVYAQYAQGFLVPNIGNLYVSNLSTTKVTPQQSTNYQLGTVIALNRLTFDGDLYYIDFQHKIQTFTDQFGQTYETNSGGATYRGIELEGAYDVGYGLAVFGNWSTTDAVGKGDLSNPLYNNQQLTGTPAWTAAEGVRLEHDQVFANNDKFVLTLTDKWIGHEYLNNAKCSNVISGICQPGATLTPVLGRLPSYDQVDLSATYTLGNYSIEAQALNLLDNGALTSAKGSAYVAGTEAFALSSAQGGANNAPEYQVPRTFEVTLKAKF